MSGCSTATTAVSSGRTTRGSPIESSPVVVDGVDYFGNWAGRVYALDLRTHRAPLDLRPGTKITSSAAPS